ncbi:hypothetical protein ABZY09_14275 [Streptomyces sp. NPDC002928]|uniref:hypothetical protein n=1 Tax=Streptomyces sp. NPDC002928 TaxID=3154440 RepID=UPI0033A8A9B0
MDDVLWLTGLTGSALCLVVHARATARSWPPSAIALGAMALMAPGAPRWQVLLACFGSLLALIGTLGVGCPLNRGRKADLLMMTLLSAAMLKTHGHHSHHSSASPQGATALAVFFVACWVALRAGSMLMERVWRTPPSGGVRVPVRHRVLGEVGAALMMVGMACMPA